MPELHAYEALVRQKANDQLVLVDSVEEWKNTSFGEVLFQTGDIVKVKQRGNIWKIGWVINLAEEAERKQFFVIGQNQQGTFQPADHNDCHKIRGLRKLYYLLKFGRMRRVK